MKLNYLISGMIAVVASIQTVSTYTTKDSKNEAYLIYTPFHPTDEDRFENSETRRKKNELE